MSHRKALLALLVGTALCAWFGRGSLAQLNESNRGDDATNRIDRRVRDFLEDVRQDRASEGLDALLDRSPLARDPKQLQALREGIPRELQNYGSYIEAEQVRIESLGTSLITATYLYKCRDYPVVWQFTFYRPTQDDSWTVVSLKFHTDYDKLLNHPDA